MYAVHWSSFEDSTIEGAVLGIYQTQEEAILAMEGDFEESTAYTGGMFTVQRSGTTTIRLTTNDGFYLRWGIQEITI